MNKLFALFCLTVLTVLSQAQFYGAKEEPMIGQSRVATNAANAGVRVDQNLGQYVKGDLTFTDDHGEKVKFSDLNHGRPMILLPIFYQCAGVCTDELDQLVRTLQGFKKDNVGQTFDVVVLSIDHSETPEMAAKKKAWYVDYYENHVEFNEGGHSDKVPGRSGSSDNWHFLVGDEANIRGLTDAIGFQFLRDPTNGQIVHPAGLVVLTPAGKISRYFLTTEYPQQILLDSLRQAARESVGVKDERPFFLACIHTNPLTGQRSLNVLNAVKTLGCLTVLILAFSIVAMTIKEKRKAKL